MVIDFGIACRRRRFWEIFARSEEDSDLRTSLKICVIPKPVWAVGFAHEQPLRDATLA
ncbi:MAG: hypothetical protein LBJ00_13060 [Planctomycetaceae bacterium]|nr:hypothetical protein [Planctomycetaceae bacterium]